jgi:MFS superfamily sulfate permease-like transporter
MRRSFVIVLLYAWMTAATNMLILAGIPSAMGVSPPSTTVTDSFQSLQQNAETITTGNVGDTLFGLLSAAIDTFELVVGVVFAVPEFLAALGVPTIIIGALGGPLAVVVIYDFMHLFSGRFGSV